MIKEARRISRSGSTIGTLVHIPKDISLRLAKLVIDRAEKGQQLTKPELIISFIEQGIKQEESK